MVIRCVPETGLGFGNQAYLWLEAYNAQQHGKSWRVESTNAMQPWLELFPLIRDTLTLPQGKSGLLDRRLPFTGQLPDQFGRDFNRTQLHDFIKRLMVPSLRSPEISYHEVVVNVRRGNYYSEPHFRGTYSFDIAGYLDVALALCRERGGPIPSVCVVSDDVEWCRLKLDELLHRHTNQIYYESSARDPRRDFIKVAAARRLIGTNSTFSYWGGYVGDVLHGRDSEVVMPRFHGRFPNGYSAYQLDPQWMVVNDIPGGWNS